MFGLVHEPKSVELYFQEYPPMSLYTGHIEDTSVFRVLLDGRNQVRLEFYVNDYYNRSPAMQEDWRTFEQKNIGITKSIIVPKLFDMLEQQRFSELFIKVFVNGDRNSANLAELKALIQNRLLPGYINIDEP